MANNRKLGLTKQSNFCLYQMVETHIKSKNDAKLSTNTYQSLCGITNTSNAIRFNIRQNSAGKMTRVIIL